jgi:murein DD-endopeptidase MepM/ murein hydrolase activator NlpD
MKVWALVFLLLTSIVQEGKPALGQAASSLEEQEKLSIIQKEIKQSKARLKQTREQQQEVLGKMVVITQELRLANRKLNRAKDKIKDNESKISQLTVELRKTEGELRQKSGLLERRVLEAYKNGRMSYLDLLLVSSSMSDFLNRFYYFEKIILQDAGLIKEVKEDLQATRVKRTVLGDRTEEIKELAGVIADQKEKIAQEAEEKKKAFEELKEREAEYKGKIAELEHSSRQLEALIQKKIAERLRAGFKGQGSGTLIWPLLGRLTSRFGAIRRWGGGYRHTGIDIATTYGSPIVAADSGEVIFAGWWDGYGKAIVLDHGHGRSTVYGHLSRIYPAVGTTVGKGQTIGLEGSTGYSTGPHLHFEVRINGVPVNPMPYLPK